MTHLLHALRGLQLEDKVPDQMAIGVFSQAWRRVFGCFFYRESSPITKR